MHSARMLPRVLRVSFGEVIPGGKNIGALPVARSTRFFEVTAEDALTNPTRLLERAPRFCPGGTMRVLVRAKGTVFRNWLTAHTEATVVSSLILTKSGIESH